ncbi:MAG: type II toxin-antitoxin system RelE/ParE family toxin [Magnetococcales bacterium]|nr:type II toxin-antitoxin system RelE/ParE family toxin [Magnetococcales bacterium]
MYTIQQTDTFAHWLAELRNMQGKAVILRRLVRAQGGNLGDVKSVGGNVSEMRVDIGPGYRIYFTTRDRTLILLLCGGDKSTQSRDIELAQRLAREC